MRESATTASIWDVPAWMVTNPGSERNRRIPRKLYPELAESMGEWLRTARDVYGADVAHVSFNEADIGVNVSLTSAEHAGLIADVGARLAARGLRTKWLLGDCANMAGLRDVRPPHLGECRRPPVPVCLRLPFLGLERLRRGAHRPLRLRSLKEQACRSGTSTTASGPTFAVGEP